MYTTYTTNKNFNWEKGYINFQFNVQIKICYDYNKINNY